MAFGISGRAIPNPEAGAAEVVREQPRKTWSAIGGGVVPLVRKSKVWWQVRGLGEGGLIA